ncbi:alpha/beta hydrolase fold domain-containing protein [Corynebacterium sp. zg-331]|uniref:alpha/beta hydrolase n=1 Tax=unclassified Corynebacterium TaxID=2624378 RepID=UPI00128BAAA4|nr:MULTISPECIES: alpha/beta hydrolase [unclassified Corynebacterium]MBC3186645.1 alpha/beta hydrolase fold domain-containing protein [Corynebacterium sp. zg-331]MPV53130.1 alpha/beta hydrolase fold domain-containing protein [Corynebacterium sp. zg331]
MSEDNTERQAFRVGGIDREFTEQQQLEQLGAYIDAHYPLPSFTPPWAGGTGDPRPADRWTALLPDRLTHAAMLMLGAGLDHSMPGVAFGSDTTTREVPEVGGRVFQPPRPTGRWAVSLHSGGWWRGSGEALEHQWRPEVAAAAALSGTTILDLDYPLAPAHDLPRIVAAVRDGADYARHQGALHVTGWGYSSGAALAVLAASFFDALALTFPDLGSVAALPEEVRAGVELPPVARWPRTLVQIASRDEIAEVPASLEGADHVEVRRLTARHRISTPEVARAKIRGVAEFLSRR